MEVSRINSNLIKRIAVCTVGSFIYATGICILTRAALGISPISSLPYVASLLCGLSLGTCTMAFNVLLITVQKIVLKKNFPAKTMVMQFLLSLVFSVFIDLTISLFGWFAPQSYMGKLAYLLFGCAVLALGVSMVVMANFAVLPGEGASQVIARVTGKEFGTAKILFDSSCVVLAIVLSLIGLGKLVGIREGTVIAALLIGTFSRFIMRNFKGKVNLLLGYQTQETPAEASESGEEKILELEASV